MKSRVDEIVNECIEAIKNKERTIEECLAFYSEERAELEQILVTALRLIEKGQVVPDPVRKRYAKEALLAAVEQKRWESGIERTALLKDPVASQVKDRLGWRRSFLRLGAISLAFALFSGATLALAEESGPGNPLYPVKIAVERARIGLATDEARANLYLEAAEKRIDELKELKSDSSYYPDLIETIAEDLEKAGVSSGRDGSVDNAAIAELVRKNEEVLRRVLENAPESARPAIMRALSNAAKHDDDTKSVAPGRIRNKPGSIKGNREDGVQSERESDRDDNTWEKTPRKPVSPSGNAEERDSDEDGKYRPSKGDAATTTKKSNRSVDIDRDAAQSAGKRDDSAVQKQSQKIEDNSGNSDENISDKEADRAAKSIGDNSKYLPDNGRDD